MLQQQNVQLVTLGIQNVHHWHCCTLLIAFVKMNILKNCTTDAKYWLWNKIKYKDDPLELRNDTLLHCFMLQVIPVQLKELLLALKSS